jgi:hypothetical protein
VEQQIKIGMRVRDIEGPVPAGLVLASADGWRFETADGATGARASIGMWIVVEDTRKPQEQELWADSAVGVRAVARDGVPRFIVEWPAQNGTSMVPMLHVNAAISLARLIAEDMHNQREYAHSQAEAETPKRVDRPRWAPEALMAIAPITDKLIELALPRGLSGNYPTNIMSATLRRLADTEVALARARAEIVGLKARAILES